MRFEDADIKRELERLDPRDALSFISLGATLLNIVSSILTPYYTFDVLISISWLGGLLSICHRDSLIARISLITVFAHLGIIALLRTFGI